MDVKSKMKMFTVSFYERQHHTNPVVTAYVRAFDRAAAVRGALDSTSQLSMATFERIDVEFAFWKQEEEVATPWNKVELT